MPAADASPAFPLVVIAGPTGSGKSALAVRVAAEFGGEIVNCDSLQLYRGFDVGTAKPSQLERRTLPHHLFDVLKPGEGYSAGDYARLARGMLAEISSRGMLPVIAGGTGFYSRALLDGLPALPGRDEALRERLLQREDRRAGSLHKLLSRLEPHAAARIHAHDVQKLIRALEVRVLTRRPIPPTDSAERLRGYSILKIGLDPPKAELYRRLDVRTSDMFASGLMEEVRGLLSHGCTGEEKPFESLGYKQALECIRGKITLEQAVLSTQIQTRQYAKRQWTWLRRDPQIRWMCGFGGDIVVVDACLKLIREHLAAAVSVPHQDPETGEWLN
jgi:tRNA dimethylallyltransferase